MQTPSSNTSAATAGSSPRVLGAGSEGWKPLTGSELLLTGAFWFQPCGLNLMVTLEVLRRSRFTGELRTPPTPTGRPRPPEAESLRSGAFWGLVPAPTPLCTAGGGLAGTTGLGAPPPPARGLRGAGPRRGEARRGPPPAAGSPRAAAAAAGPPPPSPPRSQLRRAGRRRRGPGRQQPAPTWPRPPRGGETPANAPPAPSPAPSPSPSPLGGRQHVGRAAHTARRQPARLQGR